MEINIDKAQRVTRKLDEMIYDLDALLPDEQEWKENAMKLIDELRKALGIAY